MKKLLILGAGTAGTMAANKLRKELADDWHIAVVEGDEIHYYQPGFLFLPFGTYSEKDVVRPTRHFLDDRVELVKADIQLVEPEMNRVQTSVGSLEYDYLVIATGTHPRPHETPGLTAGEWRVSVHDFYTYEGAIALRDHLENWTGGRLVVNVMETPIKCPVAPLEFLFLADDFFKQRGMRDRVELVYATPMTDVFTKPVAARRLGRMLEKNGISVETDFYVERLDPERRTLVSYDEREVGFDLLVTIPINMGAEFVAASGLGDELNHVPVDRHTFLSESYDNIFAIGDAAALPTSKAGSVAHFSVEVLARNLPEYVAGRPMTETFDGHANCFVETGDNKALLIDFNYDVEPLPGKYPIPGVGPFSLLKETELNHWGKMSFKWVYWNGLLQGRPIPLPHRMMTVGKDMGALTEGES